MANLTPEQLAALQQMMRQGGQAEYYDPATGQSFMPNNGSGWTPAGGEATEFRGYNFAPGMYSDNYDLNGTQYDKYNAQGENIGTGTWEGLRKNSAMDTLAPFAMAALPFALSMFPSLGTAASFGTNPVTGAAGGGMSAGGAGGLSGLPGGAGMDVAGFEGLTAADVAASAAPAAAGGGGLLAGASKYLGPASMLLGAAAGGQGQKTSQTSERKTDPRVDPYLFGANGQPGLLGMTYDQLSRDQSPERLAQRDQMRGVGMGLLSQPIAGNGFNRFFRG